MAISIPLYNQPPATKGDNGWNLNYFTDLYLSKVGDFSKIQLEGHENNFTTVFIMAESDDYLSSITPDLTFSEVGSRLLSLSNPEVYSKYLIQNLWYQASDIYPGTYLLEDGPLTSGEKIADVSTNTYYSFSGSYTGKLQYQGGLIGTYQGDFVAGVGYAYPEESVVWKGGPAGAPTNCPLLSYPYVNSYGEQVDGRAVLYVILGKTESSVRINNENVEQNIQTLYCATGYVGPAITLLKTNYVDIPWNPGSSPGITDGDNGSAVTPPGTGSVIGPGIDYQNPDPSDTPSITPGGPGGSSSDPYNPPGGFPGGGSATTQPTIPGSGGTPESPGSWDVGDDRVDDTPSQLQTYATGLYRTYAMSLEQVQELGRMLWSSSVLDTISKYLDNPMDVIIGMTELPVDANVSASQLINFTWLSGIGTDVHGYPISSQYKTADFGSITVERFSGTFYDFQPYSNAQVYLPYVGYIPIKVSEVVGGKLSLKYNIDVVTGAAVAILSSDKIGVLGAYNCTVGRAIPLTSRNFGQLLATVAKAALVVGGAVVGGVAGAAAASQVAAAKEYSANAQIGLTPGDTQMYKDMAAGAKQSAAQYRSVGKSAMTATQSGAGILNYMENGLSSATNATAPIQRNGSFDATTGRLVSQNAYLILSIPHQNYPGDTYGRTIGYPSNIQGKLGNFGGYNTFRSVSIVAEGATAVELDEIRQILHGGIVNPVGKEFEIL